MWGDVVAAHGWQLLAMLVLLAASGLISSSETALFNLTRAQLARMRVSDRRPVRLVASLMGRPRRLLNSLLLGNLLVNVGFSATAAVMILSARAAGMAGWLTAVLSVVPPIAVIFFGEVTPKMVALLAGPRWAMVVAGPVVVLVKALSPAVRVLEASLVRPLTRLLAPEQAGPPDLTAEELVRLLDLSARRGVIDRDANDLLREIVQLTDVRAGDIMVPRVDVVGYDVDGSPGGLVELFRRTRLRRVPVFAGDMDHVVGVVQAKRLLLKPATPLRELVEPVSYIPAAADLEKVLLQFRAKQEQVAMVVDEYGGTAGLVTLEDVLEEIVGDIPDADEALRAPAVEQVGERQYLIDGNLPLRAWAGLLPAQPAQAHVSTFGGLVTSMLGHLPAVGESVAYHNLRLTLEQMRRRRVGRLRLELPEDGA